MHDSIERAKSDAAKHYQSIGSWPEKTPGEICKAGPAGRVSCLDRHEAAVVSRAASACDE
jgi:hypothetical protein